MIKGEEMSEHDVGDIGSMNIWQETEFDAIQLPEDAPLSLVIKFINDLQFSFTDDRRAKTWKQYIKTIKLEDDKKC